MHVHACVWMLIVRYGHKEHYQRCGAHHASSRPAVRCHDVCAHADAAWLSACALLVAWARRLLKLPGWWCAAWRWIGLPCLIALGSSNTASKLRSPLLCPHLTLSSPHSRLCLLPCVDDCCLYVRQSVERGREEERKIGREEETKRGERKRRVRDAQWRRAEAEAMTERELATSDDGLAFDHRHTTTLDYSHILGGIGPQRHVRQPLHHILGSLCTMATCCTAVGP